MKLIYLYHKDQLPLRFKDIFTTNESVNPHNSRGGKLLFIHQVNATHHCIKSLRYNGPVLRNDFFRNTDNNKNFCNTGVSKFKVRLSPSEKICVVCFIESPLKMIKIAFYFILKAVFILKIFKFLS